MRPFDYFVLIASMLGIAAYGVWRSRNRATLEGYLSGQKDVGWGTIGLSVMATQASAVTFLSTPGQGFESGMGFVQNYFGLPFALIIVAAIFLPLYRRSGVYTAYEYLGKRFDGKTRLLGASLFLLQRGFASGITIYAPAIVLSTVMGWDLDITILGTGILTILYTAVGGNDAVNITQKYQMTVIFVGMATAFVILFLKLPAEVSAGDAFALAAGFDKLNAVVYSLDLNQRYTIWSGIFGGIFLSLSYFGTDQSQVQRYLSGTSVRESRLGLMFNAVMKIPMQFFILLLGVMLFVFYQFAPAPVFFDHATWERHVQAEGGGALRTYEAAYAEKMDAKRLAIRSWLDARSRNDASATERTLNEVRAAHAAAQNVRAEAKAALVQRDPAVKTKDSDYVFITFVLEQLPVGLVGLLIAVIFAAALSSLSAEMSALGTTTSIDIYHHVINPKSSDEQSLLVSKIATAGWGLVGILFALFANVVENLVEAINILGSLFYGVILGMFLVAFFLRHVRGHAVFWGAVVAQAGVLVCYANLSIGYLWYNLIGCGGCVLLSVILQAFLRPPDPAEPAPAAS
ncbi:MAG: sodium:solute symporter [Opitutaceae bacterium]|nr:sodium:solute symporter [Opitutaceae bacterium]